VEDQRVADLIVLATSENRGPLSDVEAMVGLGGEFCSQC
jgi:hypothetical protein